MLTIKHFYLELQEGQDPLVTSNDLYCSRLRGTQMVSFRTWNVSSGIRTLRLIYGHQEGSNFCDMGI